MTKPASSQGIFTISLDCELYWGMRDHVSIEEYSKNLEGVEEVVSTLLNLFEAYQVHATWAPVGFLFFPNQQSLLQHLPDIRPTYYNTDLDPYLYMRNHTVDKYHFIPDLIKKISTFTHQDIGTHTFSHFYCLEPGQTLSQFKADIANAVTITSDTIQKDVKSLVFPRNQWNETYLPLLAELNISCFRGTESHWIYQAVEGVHNTLFKRAYRLLDAYVNLTGHHTYSLEDIESKKPYNIPSSRFLRPAPKSLTFFETLRLRRILNAMTHAAQSGEIYHLWWHPHNFGADITSNAQFLKKILTHYHYLNHTYNMRSLNMREIASMLDSHRFD